MKTEIDNFTFYNSDNMEIMKQCPDKYFDLAIVDPPYGIGLVKTENGNWGQRKENKGSIDGKTQWDFERPTKEYFNELFRISKNQIIWGGNYFIDLIEKATNCFIIWDKKNGESYFSDCEIAWTSFDTAIRIFRKHTVMNNRIHICQKPVELYEYCLRYAEQGDKILDTHLGSGSIALAIDKANKLDNMNLEFVGIELDTEYFNAALNRFKLAHLQQTLFTL